jgi:hypothetical protein
MFLWLYWLSGHAEGHNTTTFVGDCLRFCAALHGKRSDPDPHLGVFLGRSGSGSTDFCETSLSERCIYEAVDSGFLARRFNGFTTIQRTY